MAVAYGTAQAVGEQMPDLIHKWVPEMAGRRKEKKKENVYAKFLKFKTLLKKVIELE